MVCGHHQAPPVGPSHTWSLGPAPSSTSSPARRTCLGPCTAEWQRSLYRWAHRTMECQRTASPLRSCGSAAPHPGGKTAVLGLLSLQRSRRRPLGSLDRCAHLQWRSSVRIRASGGADSPRWCPGASSPLLSSCLPLPARAAADPPSHPHGAPSHDGSLCAPEPPVDGSAPHQGQHVLIHTQSAYYGAKAQSNAAIARHPRRNPGRRAASS